MYLSYRFLLILLIEAVLLQKSIKSPHMITIIICILRSYYNRSSNRIIEYMSTLGRQHTLFNILYIPMKNYMNNCMWLHKLCNNKFKFAIKFDPNQDEYTQYKNYCLSYIHNLIINNLYYLRYHFNMIKCLFFFLHTSCIACLRKDIYLPDDKLVNPLLLVINYLSNVFIYSI